MKKGMVIGCLAVILVIFITCTDDQGGSKDPRGSLYAGAATCVSCHKNITDLYSHNHHFNSSGNADHDSLRAIINDSNNTVGFVNGQRVVLGEQGSAFYQTSYKGNQPIQAAKMDVVFGSAVKAQTFAYWKDSQLYQLPLTYLKEEKLWTNSPGFPVDHPYFTRPVVSRCLECHASFARVTEKREGNLLRTKQVFDPSVVVYGIDCERCHGPAAEHVKFHNENPGVKQAKFITSIKGLSRQQQLDLCGTCHSGDPVTIKSIFNFKPGDQLSKYYVFYSGASGEPDVHGMQSQLLQLSACFRQSQMTCSTCHGTHKAESTQLFIEQCKSCHQQVKHTVDINTGGNNCISCHMPLRPSKSLDFNNEKEAHNIRYMLRTHRIAVYPPDQWK